MRRPLLITTTALALLLTSGTAVSAQEASPDPGTSPMLGASPTAEQLAEAEQRLKTATCIGRPATIVAITGFETVGTSGADVIVGTGGDDVIRGGGGNDRICAGDGADVVEGGDGKDRIDGGTGDDQLDGGAGDDDISAGAGDDTVSGATGNDRLSGAGGDDSLSGGKGNDVCVGGKGTDWLPGCNDRNWTRGTRIVSGNLRLKGPHKGRIIVAKSGVTIDCGGHTVTGPGTGTGILVERRARVTIRNCDITRFNDGIQLNESNRNTVINNRTHGNSEHGIVLWSADRNKLLNNISDDNGFGRHATFGLRIDGTSKRNKVVGNHARNNGETQIGVDGAGTSKNLVRDNVAIGGDNGFTSRGERHTFIGNSASGARAHGFTDYEGTRFSVFRDNSATRNGNGISIGGRKNTVTGNAADENGFVGFDDKSVPGVNTYLENTCWNNSHQGSQPDGLCDDTIRIEPELPPQPVDGADTDGAHATEGFDTKHYEVFGGGSSWHEAVAFCEGIGAHLVTISSAEENDFVFGLEPNSWLGATDETSDGVWSWVTGEPFSYTNWAEGEPNNDGDAEHYATFAGLAQGNQDGVWNDVPARENPPFVCESATT